MSVNGNDDKLKALLVDIFMMDESQYKDENGPMQIDTWDSLATVSMAVGVHEEFGHHMTPEEVGEIRKIADIKAFLRRNGVEI